MSKPTLWIRIPSFRKFGHRSFHEAMRSLRELLSDQYNVIFTPEEIEIKSEGPVVQLEINENTNVKDLIETINNLTFEEKGE